MAASASLKSELSSDLTRVPSLCVHSYASNVEGRCLLIIL